MHDHNGTPLKVGDLVTIPCKITSLQSGEEFCNVSVETLHGRKPDGLREMFSSVNTAQLVLVDRPK